jgi:virginiamycin B lyase
MAARTVSARPSRRPLLIAALVVVVLVAGVATVAARQTGHQAAVAAGLPDPVAVPSTTTAVTPHVVGSVTTWQMPAHLVGLRGIAVGPDGRVWVTEQNTAQIASLSGDQITRYALNDTFPDAGAFAFAWGADGSLWFTGYPGGTLGRVAPDGRVNEFGSRGTGATTLGAAQGRDGAMWVTDPNLGAVVRIGVDGSVTPTLVSSDGGSTHRPAFIVRGPDDAMWFTIPDTSQIGRIDTGKLTMITVPGHVVPRNIVAAPDGVLWATMEDAPGLVRIDPTTSTAAVVPLRGSVPTAGLDDLAVAADGSLWVTTPSATVLHVTTDGQIIDRVAIPGAGYTDGVAVAPDGGVWVAARDDIIARIQP